MGSRRGPAGGRRGFTLPELVVVLLLGLLLGTLALSTLARVRTLVAAMGRRGDGLEAVRVARHVLAWELRFEGGGSMPAAAPADTLAVRAYRGVGLACPGARGRTTVTVVWRGVRAPDPSKDSVRLLAAGGGEWVAALVDVAPADACGSPWEGRALALSLSGEIPLVPVAVLAFERGSYHFTGGALRYRRGGAGRQPLTPESLATPPSRFEDWGAGRAARLDAAVFPGAPRGVLPAAVRRVGTTP